MDISGLINIGNLINIVIAILLFGTGAWVAKGANGKALAELQKTLNDTLKQEIDSLRGQLGDLEKENKRQETILLTICDAMKKRGFDIEIDGDMVTIREDIKRTTSTIRLPKKEI